MRISDAQVEILARLVIRLECERHPAAEQLADVVIDFWPGYEDEIRHRDAIKWGAA